jgi:hypothetical protein
MVSEQVFGKPKPGAEQGNAVSPMHTDPTTCRIVEEWDIATYRKRGLPDIIYDADRRHEEVHRASCLAKGPGNALQYNADMSFPEKLSKDEVKAYSAKLDILETWFTEHCGKR